MNSVLRGIIDFFSSLKLTIYCLAFAAVLVFAGTIAQVYFGTEDVQRGFFQSFVVMFPPRSNGMKYPVYPGGHLIGAVLLLNLITAHIRRFRWTWKKTGIQLIHAGLIIMLAGGLFTDLFAVHSMMRFSTGEAKNYSEDSQRMELAVIDASGKDLDQVTAIPLALLRKGGTIEHGSLPFRIVVRRYFENAAVRPVDAPADASQGAGPAVAVTELPPSTKQNERDMPAVEIEIVPIPTADMATTDSLGTWVVYEQVDSPPTFMFAGKPWRLEMRPVRYYKPYTLTLQKVTHEVYAGTDIPKNFASKVTLVDPGRNENRDVLIYMNHPLRYHGETYYQASVENNDTTSVFEAVHNPSFLAPYVACMVVAAGLLFQFGYHFAEFTRRQKTALAATA
jgi:hypothetical protein